MVDLFSESLRCCVAAGETRFSPGSFLVLSLSSFSRTCSLISPGVPLSQREGAKTTAIFGDEITFVKITILTLLFLHKITRLPLFLVTPEA